MVRLFMTVALVFALGLSAAGCGAQNASTAAHRWDMGRNDQVQSEMDENTLKERADGEYHADTKGEVEGFRTEGRDLGEDMKNAGEDLIRGAEDAAKGVGGAMEETLDGLTGTPKNSSR